MNPKHITPSVLVGVSAAPDGRWVSSVLQAGEEAASPPVLLFSASAATSDEALQKAREWLRDVGRGVT